MVPIKPLDSVGVGFVRTTQVETVEIGLVTGPVPPGTLVYRSTVNAIIVVVAVRR